MSHWIDVHAHLDKLEEGPNAALELAQNGGVDRLITIGTEPSDLPIVLEFAQKFSPTVFCTLGIHPHEAGLWDLKVADYIKENSNNPRVLGLGEMGLDYYYNNSTPQTQKKAFLEQLQLAQEVQLPIEVHTRDAENDTMDLLRPFKGKVRGLIHCFTGTQELAKQSLDLGFNISISGVVTFKNAHELRGIVKYIPLDRLHIETDAPFLAPIPHRGKKNTPVFMLHTAEQVAQLKGVTLEELKIQTWKNAQNLFSRLC